MDRAADAGTRRERRVGGIDDGVNSERRDVALEDVDVFGVIRSGAQFAIARMLRRIETHQPE